MIWGQGDMGIQVPPWVGKIPWRRKWQPTPVFLLRRSLTVNLRLRKVKGGEVGRKVGQGKSAVVTSKVGGEDVGGPCPGAVLGWKEW